MLCIIIFIPLSLSKCHINIYINVLQKRLFYFYLWLVSEILKIKHYMLYVKHLNIQIPFLNNYKIPDIYLYWKLSIPYHRHNIKQSKDILFLNIFCSNNNQQTYFLIYFYNFSYLFAIIPFIATVLWNKYFNKSEGINICMFLDVFVCFNPRLCAKILYELILKTPFFL